MGSSTDDPAGQRAGVTTVVRFLPEIATPYRAYSLTDAIQSGLRIFVESFFRKKQKIDSPWKASPKPRVS
jgi:hypothetical protein